MKTEIRKGLSVEVPIISHFPSHQCCAHRTISRIWLRYVTCQVSLEAKCFLCINFQQNERGNILTQRKTYMVWMEKCRQTPSCLWNYCHSIVSVKVVLFWLHASPQISVCVCVCMSKGSWPWCERDYCVSPQREHSSRGHNTLIHTKHLQPRTLPPL